MTAGQPSEVHASLPTEDLLILFSDTPLSPAFWFNPTIRLQRLSALHCHFGGAPRAATSCPSFRRRQRRWQRRRRIHLRAKLRQTTLRASGRALGAAPAEADRKVCRSSASCRRGTTTARNSCRQLPFHGGHPRPLSHSAPKFLRGWPSNCYWSCFSRPLPSQRSLSCADRPRNPLALLPTIPHRT